MVTLSSLSFPTAINKDDSDGKRLHLSYSKTDGWKVERLSNLERIAKILPDGFLKKINCEYIANTKLSHIISHRDKDLGDKEKNLQILNEIFDRIVKKKGLKIEGQFFPSGEPSSTKPSVSTKSAPPIHATRATAQASATKTTAPAPVTKAAATKPVSHVTSIKPIKRIGNDCYMIAMLQSLSNCPSFIKAINGIDETNKNRGVLQAVRSFLKTYQTSSDPEVLRQAMVQVKKSIHAVHHFNSFDSQQDAHEALTVILDTLGLKFSCPSRLTFPDNLAPIDKPEDIGAISIEFNEISIQASLDHFFSKEQVSDIENYFDHNGVMTAFDKQYVLESLPDFMTLHLKRFDEHGRKIEAKLDVDEIIDLGRYTADKKPAYYRVKAVVEHLGNTPQSGHYIARVRDGEDWFNCNDDDIKRLNGNDVGAEKGYMFFLERIPDGTPIQQRLIGKRS